MEIKEATKQEEVVVLKQFHRLDIDEDEEACLHFITGILDRFDRVLSEEEAAQLLTNYEADLKYEDIYLKFFEEAFKLNGQHPVYIFSPSITSLSNSELKLMANYLNEEEFNTLRKLPSKTKLFKVSNINLIKFFAKLSIRELCFSNFFFVTSRSVILGNYELCFPIYCLEDESFHKYQNQARQLGLYLRI